MEVTLRYRQDGCNICLENRGVIEGIIHVDEVKVQPTEAGNYWLDIYLNGYIGHICAEEVRSFGRPVEVSNKEKRHMARMMQDMNMIRKDDHTLD